MYSFAGGCSYLLAGDCQERSFSILGEFWISEQGQLRWGRVLMLVTHLRLKVTAENVEGRDLPMTPCLEDNGLSMIAASLSLV